MADARAENPLSRWLTELEASRPGAHRTADLPMLSPHIACGIAFVVYPSVVLGLQALLAGRAYATDARWLRYIGAVHNALLGVFSLGMWLGVFYTLGTDSTYSSAVEFFCLPSAEPVMPARLPFLPMIPARFLNLRLRCMKVAAWLPFLIIYEIKRYENYKKH